MTKKLTILGSTGSIGTQALNVCRGLEYEVSALAANRNTALLEKQAREFHPRYVAVCDESACGVLKTRLADTDITVLAGLDGLCELASLPENDVVLNSVIGMVGLRPTLAAIAAGTTVALANKETLVAGGQLVTAAAAKNGVELIPVDSEHSAIYQSLRGSDRRDVKKIILTASGGPFRGKTTSELEAVTLADALNHPNWSMGAKITVDSATLMNKGLEFIEAMWLFSLTPEQIEIVVHPQSVVHSAVEYLDGAVIAQLGSPDMAVPIQYALTYPRRYPSPAKPLSLTAYGSLTFEAPDTETFPCLRHCIAAAQKGGLYPCAVNGANEQAVELFLAGGIKYAEIGRAVGHVLETISPGVGEYTIDDVMQTDAAARVAVLEYCRTA